MDSIAHTRVANILLKYVEETCGVKFDQTAFVYGNLKPDLTGTYFTKRHNPSVMYDEVMDMIRDFTGKYTLAPVNGKDISVDLGEICHYITDFFCFPHNDDIYNKSLLAHYIYEKRTSIRIGRRIDYDKFERWASPLIPPFTVDALIASIGDIHEEYKATSKHGIANDIQYISRICAMVVLSIVNITYEMDTVAEGATVTA